MNLTPLCFTKNLNNMPKKYLSTTTRQEFESQDKLGKNESFEARTRGALSPYWTLVALCDQDLEDPVIRKFIKDAVPKHEGHKANLLELLSGSEEDRADLYDNIEELIEAWESLPEGHHSPDTIAKWLLNDMKPVMDKLRK